MRREVDLSGHRIAISGPFHLSDITRLQVQPFPAHPVPIGVYIAARATILSPRTRTHSISHHARRALVRGIPRLAGYN